MKYLVGFIAVNHKNKFVPMVGRAIDSPGDNDAFIDVLFTHPASERLEVAQAALIKEQSVTRLFLSPTKSGAMGFWLSSLGKETKRTACDRENTNGVL